MKTIKELRAAAGLSQTQAAKATGLSQTRISKIEGGEGMSVDAARRLAGAYGVTVDEIVGGPIAPAAA